MIAMTDRKHPDELEELWALVDELGSLSVRLQTAAEAAIKSIDQMRSGETNKESE